MVLIGKVKRLCSCVSTFHLFENQNAMAASNKNLFITIYYAIRFFRFGLKSRAFYVWQLMRIDAYKPISIIIDKSRVFLSVNERHYNYTSHPPGKIREFPASREIVSFSRNFSIYPENPAKRDPAQSCYLSRKCFIIYPIDISLFMLE